MPAPLFWAEASGSDFKLASGRTFLPAVSDGGLPCVEIPKEFSSGSGGI